MIINKYKGNGGGGGGSYVLPVATSNSLGGVKVGSGLSIDAGGVLSAAGGGDYRVVSQLPVVGRAKVGSATEGALYYRLPYVEYVEYRGVSITTTASEDFAAHIYDGEGKEYHVYISGNDFNWGYQNDGEYHKKDNAEFWYKTDNANKIINIYLPDDTWTVRLEENATSAETSPYTVQIPHDAQTYRFNGTGYDIAGGYDDIYLYFDYNDNGNQEKTQELANKILSVQKESRKNIRLFVSGFSSKYITSFNRDQLIQFIPTLDDGQNLHFTSNVLNANGGGALNNPIFISCSVPFSGREFNFEMEQVPFLFVLKVDPVSHSLNENGEIWMHISRSVDSRRPIIQLKYNDTIFNAVYKSRRIYLDAKKEGINLHGVWSINDEGSSLIEWSETPDIYQSVEGLSNAGIDTASFKGSIYSVAANAITSLTEETELFVNNFYQKCKVTTDGTVINMYGEDGEGGWALRGSGSWTGGTIETTGIRNYPEISEITTGETTYQFRFVYREYQDPGETISITPFYKPFEGLLAFNKSNESLNLYDGWQWSTIYPNTYQLVSDLSNAGKNTASFKGEVYSIPANVITGLTEETELFVNDAYGTKCKVTTDGTVINMYGEDEAGGWVKRGSGSWTGGTIETTDFSHNPKIYDITTGETIYKFRFVFAEYNSPGITLSKTPFYQPFEGLLAFNKSNASLNLYTGGQWKTIYPQS